MYSIYQIQYMIMFLIQPTLITLHYKSTSLHVWVNVNRRHSSYMANLPCVYIHITIWYWIFHVVIIRFILAAIGLLLSFPLYITSIYNIYIYIYINISTYIIFNLNIYIYILNVIYYNNVIYWMWYILFNVIFNRNQLLSENKVYLLIYHLNWFNSKKN